jgi:WD40 repeat protein
LWDFRQRGAGLTLGSAPQAGAYGKSTVWASQVRWRPDSNAQLLACTDYDGGVCLWDVRSSLPLGRTEAHDGKALCCDWVSHSPSKAKGRAAGRRSRANSDMSVESAGEGASGGSKSAVLSGGSDSKIACTSVLP